MTIEEMQTQSLKPKKVKRKIKQGRVFCIVTMSLLLGQWAIFYMFSRFNSIFTSFQYYDGVTDKYYFLPWNRLFENYTNFFKEVFVGDTWKYILNGYKFWLYSAIVAEFSILIAFYIYKKMLGSSVMYIILLLPGTLAGIANPLLFKYFVEKALPTLASKLGWKGNYSLLFSRQETALTMTIVMSTFLAFPGSLLYYVAQFSRIPNELIEAARLEGITIMKEFWYIAFPSVFAIWSLGHLGILTAGLTTMGPGYALYEANGYKYGVVTFQYDILVRVLGNAQTSTGFFYPTSAAINMTIAILAIIGIQIMRFIFGRVDKDIQF